VDLEQLKVHVQLSSEETQAEVTVQEITVLDLAKGSASSADVVLTRWQQSGSQLLHIAGKESRECMFQSAHCHFVARTCTAKHMSPGFVSKGRHNVE